MRLTDKTLKEFEKIYREEFPDKNPSPEELRDTATRFMRMCEIVYSHRMSLFAWAEHCLEKDWIYNRYYSELMVFPTFEEIHKHISRYVCDGKERFWDYSKSNPLFWVRKPY